MAAAEYSFDVVSRADSMEVKNALDQAQKELHNRWDLKNTKCEILVEKEKITLVADDEFRMDQLQDILLGKLVKRGIDPRLIEWGKLEPGAGVSVRRSVETKQGIPQEKAKPLIKRIKDEGPKVNAQIQGDEIRISSKSKDDLQKAITYLKGLDLDFPVEFVNFR